MYADGAIDFKSNAEGAIGSLDSNVYGYILAVGDNNLEYMYGTTQGTTVFKSGDNNKRLLLGRSIVEECKLLSLLILDRTGAMICSTTRNTQGETSGNTGTATIGSDCCLPMHQRQPSELYVNISAYAVSNRGL